MRSNSAVTNSCTRRNASWTAAESCAISPRQIGKSGSVEIAPKWKDTCAISCSAIAKSLSDTKESKTTTSSIAIPGLLIPVNDFGLLSDYVAGAISQCTLCQTRPRIDDIGCTGSTGCIGERNC